LVEIVKYDNRYLRIKVALASPDPCTFLIALKKGKGENVKIPLNEILGVSHYGGIRIQYWMNGNTKQPYAHADILY